MATVIPKTPVFCDLSRGYFVTGRNSTEKTQQPFGQFFSKNALNLEIYPLVLNPTAAINADPFNVVDVSGLSLVLSILKADGSAVLATQSSFTADAAAGTLTGILDCNTGDMGTYVAADPTRILIEARFTSSGVSKNVRAEGTSTEIRQQFNYTGTPTPVANDTYLTEAMIRAMFVPRDGSQDRGKGFTLVSQDGTKTFLVFGDNDGSVKLDPIS